MPCPAPTLEQLSEHLLALGGLARRLPAGAFLCEALHTLQTLLRFRSGWWGLALDADRSGPPAIYQSQSLGLPEHFAADWLAIAAEDHFGDAIRAQPGQVQRGSDAGLPLPEAVRAFDRRHGIEHAMGLALEDAATGHGFFICLYRGPADEPFSDTDARCFGVWARHLLQLWQFALQDALRAGPGGAPARAACADRSGRLVYVGTRLGEWLLARWPGWDGLRLPPDFSAALQGGSLPAAAAGLRCSLQGEQLWLLLDEECAQEAPLSPRRRQVAQLFAQGQSSKEIARQLGLTPATVRTYLRDAYLALQVRNKVELGGALGMARGAAVQPER
ncbi:MAG: LuxR C-terminal-related transcriptional regulator [Inhella sp.]